MIALYFGLPGAGKTTILAQKAYDAVKKGKYDHVYTNVKLNMPGVTYIDNDCIGQFQLENCLLLIDEATLFADSRAYKSFDKDKLQYFLMHRHYHVDIILFTQQWDGVDRKIRVITDRVYYIYKTWLTGPWISKCYRIPYGIIIPDPKKGGEKLGEIIQGYARPPWFVRLFAMRVYRPRYYKYFDSWEAKPLKELPATYETIIEDEYKRPIASRWWRVTKKFLKSSRKKARKEKYARFFKRIWLR